MVLMGKKVRGHPSNCATFASEFIVEDYPFGGRYTYKYSTSNIHLKLLPSYYNQLNAKEKESIIRRSFTPKYYLRGYDEPSGPMDDATITADFYLLSNEETNAGNRFEDSVNVGFSDNNSRKKRYENGDIGMWYVRNAEWDQSDGYDDTKRTWQRYIDTSGIVRLKDLGVGNGPEVFVYGIVPACDISLDAYVALDSDGYYRILGM